MNAFSFIIKLSKHKENGAFNILCPAFDILNLLANSLLSIQINLMVFSVCLIIIIIIIIIITIIIIICYRSLDSLV